MAVTLVAADLIYPAGKLQKAWFSPTVSETLEAVVGEWLDLAATEVAALDDDDLEDAAATHYIYWRAYESIALRIAGAPQSEQSGGGQGFSRTWKLPDQIDYWQGKADVEKAQFDALIAGETATTRAASVFDRVPGGRGR
jgi:hypothetical protein